MVLPHTASGSTAKKQGAQKCSRAGGESGDAFSHTLLLFCQEFLLTLILHLTITLSSSYHHLTVTSIGCFPLSRNFCCDLIFVLLEYLLE